VSAAAAFAAHLTGHQVADFRARTRAVTATVMLADGEAAPAVLAILGLDIVHNQVPRREPGPRAVPDPFRRAARGKGRRRR
jgi:hypothetical protein